MNSARRISVAGFFPLWLLMAVAVAQGDRPDAPELVSIDGRSLLDASVSWQNSHDFTRLPMTADGWTDLLALYQHGDLYRDSRIIYVSSSEGDDASAQTYSAGDAEIGNNPFNPTGTIRAFASLEAANARRRDGYPDILLLKGGDVWSGNLLNDIDFHLSGRSGAERQIVSTYGNSARRAVILSNTGFLDIVSDDTLYVIVSGLEITPLSRAPADGPVGVRWLAGGQDILFEDVKIAGYRNNLVFQAYQGSFINDIAIRRSVIVDSWSATSHSQGIFTAGIGRLLIEESVFDHNGWNESVAEAEATIFNRSMYFSDSPNVIVRGTIDANGASGGTQLRQGGIYEKNLSLRNPTAVSIGHPQTQAGVTSEGSISYNVILDSRDIGSNARGFGIVLSTRLNDVVISENIIAHQKTGTGNVLGIFISREESAGSANIQIGNNVVYDWGEPNGVAIGFRGQPILSNVSISANDFVLPGGGMLVADFDPSQDVLWSGNRYYSADAESSWFDLASGSVESFADWSAATGENGSAGLPQYSSPGRDIAAYMLSIGEAGGFSGFMNRARNLSRDTWDPRFTAKNVINYVRAGFNKPPVD